MVGGGVPGVTLSRNGSSMLIEPRASAWGSVPGSRGLLLSHSCDPSPENVMVTMTWLTRCWNVAALCLVAVGLAACEDNSDGITDPDPTAPATFESTAAGYYHSCAVASNGVAYCWGYNRPSGQLGDGT